MKKKQNNKPDLQYLWNRTAIECYEIGCQCEICFLYRVYFNNSPDECKMKKVVKKLIRKVGIPLQYEKKICQKKRNIA